MGVVAGAAGLAPGQGGRGCASVASVCWAAGRATGTTHPAGGCNAPFLWSRLLWGSPPAPHLHRGPECGEGAPACHTAMGDEELRPERLHGTQVG